MKDNYDFSKGKRGAVISAPGKTRITIHIDNDVLDSFRQKARAEGKGYQTLINDMLKQSIQQQTVPVTEELLRRVIREELKVA